MQTIDCNQKENNYTHPLATIQKRHNEIEKSYKF